MIRRAFFDARIRSASLCQKQIEVLQNVWWLVGAVDRGLWAVGRVELDAPGQEGWLPVTRLSQRHFGCPRCAREFGLFDHRPGAAGVVRTAVSSNGISVVPSPAHL